MLRSRRSASCSATISCLTVSGADAAPPTPGSFFTETPPRPTEPRLARFAISRKLRESFAPHDSASTCPTEKGGGRPVRMSDTRDPV
ncbi:hypothetical protein T484DRAFT_1942382 [Baffinella frigidus]|nr:hypothetical protein T484DRAFT_1942382 [Cryptophyta sp. CCMP2293]